MKVIRVESCQANWCKKFTGHSASRVPQCRAVKDGIVPREIPDPSTIPTWCPLEDDLSDYPGKPPCRECGAMTQEEAELKCICSGDKDHCHGADLWE